MKNNYNKKDPKLYKSQHDTWKVRFFDTLIFKYRDKSFKTKTIAENFKRAVSRGECLANWLKDNEAPAKEVKTFKDLSKLWIDHGRYTRRISESCLMNYGSHLKNHILPTIGHIHPGRLSENYIELLAKEIAKKMPQSKSYLAVRKQRWDDEGYNENALGIVYQREILTTACMITSWASKRKPALLHENPFENFKLPKTPEHLYDYWTLEQEDKFLDWLEDGGHYEKETTRYQHINGKKRVIKLQLRNHEELHDIVLFALRTGMRLGEIGAIRNKDVDLLQGFIIVRASYSRKEKRRKNTTKSKKARRIEINEDVRNILHRRRFKDPDEPLFNINMNSIKFFSRTCRWAGVKEIHFHSLRHTCLTNLANGYGMVKPLPLPKVQQIAGHSDIKTTMRYVHADIINETASLQFSRAERSLSKQEKSPQECRQTTPKRASKPNVGSIKKGLRLIHSR